MSRTHYSTLLYPFDTLVLRIGPTTMRLPDSQYHEQIEAFIPHSDFVLSCPTLYPSFFFKSF